MADSRDDFFVGYRPRISPDLARHLRRVSIVLLGIAPVMAGVLIALQARFADSYFEYGIVREFEGRLDATPYPALAVSEPADLAGRTVLLVDFGKKGAGERVSELDGRQLRLSGQLIHRGDVAMVELTSASIENLRAGDKAGYASSSLGERVLVGEIVDSKCHLGVMKPGDGKPHRACAARCISGGAPPILWVRDRQGEEAHYLLTGRDGRPLGGEILDLVAGPVEITGELVRSDDLWFLRTEPREIIRVTADG